MRLIDADALLEKFAKLEAIALEYVGKLNERKDPNEHDMWVMWTGILNERTAYKYEIIDAPTIDAEPVRHGKWVFNPSDAFEAMFAKPKCSECGFESADGGNYCPNCGARMDEE
jgi:hypothetical protein